MQLASADNSGWKFDHMLRLQRASPVSHHPDHDVGEGGDPQGGGSEGQHEPVFPARRGAVGDGEEQQQTKRPSNQPLQLITGAGCERTGNRVKTEVRGCCRSSKAKLNHVFCLATSLTTCVNL